MSDKKYIAPGFYVTRYTADRAFASTTCTTTSNGSYTSSYTVNCVANGSEKIFADSNYGCEFIINGTSGTNWYFYTYTDSDGETTNYFCWYDSSIRTAPGDTTMLEAIFGSDYQGWHAGTYDENIVSLFTNSY